VSDLVEMRVVGTEFEADVICGLLRESGIECEHRGTNLSAGAQDGFPGGGPRVVLVRSEDAERAQQVLEAQP
jgi:hypothetical protein